MRIISGIYKGRKLSAGNDLSIRPTTDRVKEFIFSILQDFQENKVVADIFSGSGNLGIEALSRGAKKIVFVEKNNSSIEVLQKNLEKVKIDSSAFQILNLPAETFVYKNHKEIGLYFLDPPFNIENLQHLLNTLTSSDNFVTGDLIVLEHEVSNPIKLESVYYRVLKQKKLGRSLITFIEKGSTDGK